MPRRPDVPCAGGCGRLLWSSNTSLPTGRRMCQSCRRRRALTHCPRGHPWSAPDRRSRDCRQCRPKADHPELSCARCGASFIRDRANQRFCSRQCRERTGWSKRNDAIIRARRSKAYKLLRRQVLDEEHDCWLCEQPITEEWPSPMCGTIDHIVPVSVDPSRILDRSNVHAAHLRCNSRRTDFQFRKRMLVA